MTNEEYQAVMPIISSRFTVEQVETFVALRTQAPEPTPDPEITNKALIAIADAHYRGIHTVNGVGGLMRATGLRRHQVIMIIAELKAYDALSAAEAATDE